MLAHLSAAKLIYACDQSVEEVAVVAHTDERAVKVGQSLFQHVLGAQVEVVGRFVKNEQVDGFEQTSFAAQI